MSKTYDIYCVNTASYMEAEGGETLGAIAERLYRGVPLRDAPICARVNNKTENLGYAVFAPKQVEFLDSLSASGQRVYTRSLCMMLYRAVTTVFPETRLRIEHSISNGYYCRLTARGGDTVAVTEADTRRIAGEMRRLAEADLPLVRHERLTSDVIKTFRSQGLDDKVLLLESQGDLYTTYYELDGIADSYYGPLAPSTGYVDVFDIRPMKEGFLLLGFDASDRSRPAAPKVQEKMYGAFTDYLRFNRIIGIENVGELNRAVKARDTARLINVAEAMHDKLLGRISDEIARRREEGGARIILLAGPSSSGKTTTCKRLAVQLMTNLIVPKMISLDDYFVDRELTPRDESGDYDYESLHALDLARFNSDLTRLLAGEEINLPTYSFELGRRVEKRRPLSLGKHDVLLIEGIHGLNPELTAALPPRDIYKVYVSALTTLHIDDHNWISTTDNRLLRRIVRDNKYRHTSALDTLRRWPSVRRGEERWIFPFQENADATFNSSLIFELGVMKPYAEPLLHDVPHNVEQYAQAYRLMRLLEYFQPITAAQIPSTSLLREFLGGSSFRY